MDRLYLLAPALLGITFLLVMLGVYTILCLLGRTPDVAGLNRRKFSEFLGPFLVRYMLWLIRPVERAFVIGGVSPNVVTFTSMLLCVSSGVAAASGSLATASWLYAFAGITDILDGRIARATGKQTKAGALFDSVSDRWGELAVFTGLAWYLHETAWLLAVMLAIAGSMMVSYTRARGEGLGVALDGGLMQRAERIVVVAVGMMVAAWFNAGEDSGAYAAPALGSALVLCGALASFTAIGRWIEGYKLLLAKEPPAPAPVAEADARARFDAPPPAPNPMRITGEHTA